MPNANNEAQQFYQNLVDAGCSGDMIERCVYLKSAGEEKQLFLMLRDKRRELLDSIHSFQSKLDCLDYLVYQLEKKN